MDIRHIDIKMPQLAPILSEIAYHCKMAFVNTSKIRKLVKKYVLHKLTIDW